MAETATNQDSRPYRAAVAAIGLDGVAFRGVAVVSASVAGRAVRRQRYRPLSAPLSGERRVSPYVGRDRRAAIFEESGHFGVSLWGRCREVVMSSRLGSQTAVATSRKRRDMALNVEIMSVSRMRMSSTSSAVSAASSSLAASSLWDIRCCLSSQSSVSS